VHVVQEPRRRDDRRREDLGADVAQGVAAPSTRAALSAELAPREAPGLQLEVVVNARIAWATTGKEADPARVFRSLDGGQHWSRLGNPCPHALASDLLFAALDARHAWLLCLGEPGTGNQRKALFEMTDGRQWAPLTGRGMVDYGYGRRLLFASTRFGLLMELRGGLFVTRDGGRRWRQARITSPEVREPQGVAVFSPSSALVLVRDDSSRRVLELYRTEDAARSWRLVHAWR
jgi:photosystem II stability/assembly factor-like uncharacterized protein